MLFIAPSRSGAQQSEPDLILTNAKIVTVDDRFTIGEAIAVKGERARQLVRAKAYEALAAKYSDDDEAQTARYLDSRSQELLKAVNGLALLGGQSDASFS